MYFRLLFFYDYCSFLSEKMLYLYDTDVVIVEDKTDLFPLKSV